MRSIVLTHTDVGRSPLAEMYPRRVAGVTIGKGVYLGANVTVLPGSQVGDGSLVAAGAVVTRDVPPRMVVAGVPARIVKNILPAPRVPGVSA